MNIKKLNIQENFLKSKNHTVSGRISPLSLTCQRCNKKLSEVYVANLDTFELVCWDEPCFSEGIIHLWLTCECTDCQSDN